MSYTDIWIELYSQQLYDIQLADGSLLSFAPRSYRPLKVSYSYLECPFSAPSYEDFLVEVLVLDPSEVGDEFRKEYEDHISTLPPKPSVTPIRYDYEPDTYNPGIHPASHMHVGASGEIRIATRRILRPLSFTLFVLRHCYPHHWLRFTPSSTAPTICRNIRDTLDIVDPVYHAPIDDWHMALD